MKFSIFCLFTLVIATTFATAQEEGRTFYDVCESNEQTWVDFRRDTISVKTFSIDSLVFVSGGVKYFANKAPGQDFLEGGKDDSHFFAYRVDDTSFFIANTSMTAFAYYHADKRRGDEADNKKRCAVDALNTFEAMAKPYGEKQREQRNSDYEARTKAVTTEYVKNLRSQRADPALEKDIMKWWKGPDPTKIPDPVLKIYFLMADYHYTRNDYGTVLRKTIDALILWKERTGTKCWVQWRSFGYESPGPGVFEPNMRMWTKDDALGLPEYRKIQAGAWSEVDCAAFVR